MIAYVSKHDAVKTHIRNINGSREREVDHQTEHGGDGAGASTADDHTDSGHYGSEHPLDPTKNRPWKIHRVDRHKLKWLKYSIYEPSLKLSAEEHKVVMGESPNGVLLLGRSGTGKTICVVSRMDKDRVDHMEEVKSKAVVVPKELRQLFVARSGRLCALARNMYNDNINTYKKAGEYSTKELDKAKKDMKCKSHDEVISLIEEHLDGVHEPRRGHLWKGEHARDTRVTPSEFFNQVWPALVSKNEKRAKEFRELELDEGTVWTQIRSFIKGSEHAVRCGRPLLKEEYIDETLLPLTRCSLNVDQRTKAFDVFLQYTEMMQSNAKKTCKADGCTKQAVFGVDGKEPVYCQQHKEDDHVRGDFIGECLSCLCSKI
jgi:hypothetical protein